MTPESLLFLRERRLEARLSLRNFCLAYHLEPTFWSRAERGNREFSSEVIEKVKEILSLSPEEIELLLSWEPIPEEITSYLPAFPHKDFPLKEYIDNLKTTID